MTTVSSRVFCENLTEEDEGKSCWRYQLVYTVNEHSELREYSICEIYLDENGKLKMWTESPAMRPYGNDEEELIGDLQLMLNDARSWDAVPFDALEKGITFKRSQKEKMN